MTTLHAFSMVEYRANGCFGVCPAYTVRFFPDGRAAIGLASIDGFKMHARATVPFARIFEILQTANAAELRSEYGVRVVDTFGAHLYVLFRHGFSFDSDAPDRTQWSPGFQDISDRIDQLVLDTTWTPPLPPRRSLYSLR